MSLWSSGAVYETYMGRWSRLVAAEHVGRLGADAGLRWVDVGCGTGALTSAVLDQAVPRSIVGIDPSAAFVEHAAAHVRDSRASFRVGEAGHLPVPDESADVVVSGLVLNFVPDPAAAAREMRRVLVPGGVVGCYVWDYADGMRMLRHFWDVAASLDPTSREADQGERFEICRPEALRRLVTDAGFDDAVVDDIVVPTVFRDFDDYWSPFLAGRAPAPSYVMSLAVDRRKALRAALRESLPTAPDGSVRLTARAWVVRGSRPGP
jgi:SAM-dependent methyltransferase